jgi:hypothetical protein
LKQQIAQNSCLLNCGDDQGAIALPAADRSFVPLRQSIANARDQGSLTRGGNHVVVENQQIRTACQGDIIGKRALL